MLPWLPAEPGADNGQSGRGARHQRAALRPRYPASVPGRLIAAWRFGALDLVLSDFILAALRRTLPRLVHRHGLTLPAIDDLIDSLSILADLVKPEVGAESDLTDRNDLPVLGLLARVSPLKIDKEARGHRRVVRA